MTRISIFFFSAVLFLAFSNAGFSQRLVNALSDKQISIDSSFAGETISFYGNIEPEIGEREKSIEGTFNIIMVITGPSLDRVVRKKSNKFIIWLNSSAQVYEKFPSYYWVLSDASLDDITTPEVLEEYSILPKHQPQKFSKNVNEDNRFDKELVRLMKEDGYFGIDENAIDFHSNSFYSGRLELPANVPVGSYLVQTYLLKDGEIISQKAQGFFIRKTGFERFLGNFAKQSSLLYGVFAVILALFTGWLGGVAFRR